MSRTRIHVFGHSSYLLRSSQFVSHLHARDRAFRRSTQLEEEQALRKRALDQLTGRASRKAPAVEAAAEDEGARQRRRGPDASRLSFETQDRAGESGEEE
jgi:hypothetical protein